MFNRKVIFSFLIIVVIIIFVFLCIDNFKVKNLNYNNKSTTILRNNNQNETSTKITEEVEYLFYSEKSVYSLDDKQLKFIIMREDGEEFSYSQRHKLYIKENDVWILIPTLDKNNTFKPIAYKAIKGEGKNAAKGFVYVYLNKFDFTFKPSEYKIELISFEDVFTAYFKIA